MAFGFSKYLNKHFWMLQSEFQYVHSLPRYSSYKFAENLLFV